MASKRKILKKITKAILILLLLLCLLLVGFYFAIQSPRFQTFLAKKITEVVSNSIGTEVHIGAVDIEFFNKVHLSEFLIKDMQNDTLAYFKTTEARLNYFSLFQKDINFNSIAIEELYVNIYRVQNDTSFNFAFLNQNKQQMPKDTTQVSEWLLKLSTFSLNNTVVNYKDSLTGIVLETNVPKLITNVNEFDLKNKWFEIEDIVLSNPQIYLTVLENRKEGKTPFLIDIPVFLSSKKLKLQNGNFNFINTLDTNNYKYLAYNKLQLNDINLEIKDTYLNSDSINLEIIQLSLAEQSGLCVNSLLGKFAIDNNIIKVENLSLITNKSRVNADAELKFESFEAFKNFGNEVRFETNLRNTVIDPKDLQYFTDFNSLGIRGLFKIDGELKGKLSSLRANNIVLKAGRQTEIRGDFSLNGLPNIKETFISLRTEKLTTNYEDVKYIYSKLILPINAKKLGTIVFKGKFDGFYSDFVTFGEVSTKLGYVNTDINFKMSKDGTPSYSGKVNAKEFKIGEWFGIEEQLGSITLTAGIKGKGVKLETLDATLNGKVNSVVFKGYNYTNIEVDGSLKNKFFEGNAKIDDENLKMNFSGLVDASQKNPVYDFTAALEKIDIKALNLSKLDYILSGNLKSNFSASSIDDILGQLDIDTFNIATGGKNYKLNKLSIKSIDKGYEKEFKLTADNINLTIAGNYEISTLPKAVRYIFLPSDSTLHSNQILRIDAEITDNTELISLFVPKLKIPNKILISANLNTESESLLASITIPKIKYDKLKANNFVSNVFVKNGQIDMINSLPEILLNDSVLVKDISILASGTKDDLNFTINAANKTDYSGLNLFGNLAFDGDFYNLKLDTNSTIFINNSFWDIARENIISFNKKTFITNDFRFSSNKSEANFMVNQNNGQNNLVVSLKNINVEDFNEILLEKGIDLRGQINGEVKIDNFDKQPAINGDLSFVNIYVNDYNIGDFKLESRVDLPDKKVYMSGGLYSKENHIDINGMYSFDKISTKEDFNIDIFIKQFTVKSLEDFIPTFISKSSGTLNGNLKLIGSRKKPNLNGYVEVNDVTTTVSFTQVQYTIAKTIATFKNNEIILADKVVVQDNEGNVAYGSGKILHKNFKDWELDLSVVTNKIKGLNTKIEDNPDFYGTAYIKGGATFKGVTNEPLIYIYGESVGNSFLDVPLSEGVKNQEYQFYNFVTKKTKDDYDDEEKEIAAVKVMGAKVKLDLDINQNLELKIILDRDAGDVLKVKGEGNIKIDVGQQAEYVDFFGTYNVTKGDYLFTMQNIINKPFKIEPNSKINFNGDIYKEATIDMSATYTRKVALDDFISEYLAETDEDLRSISKNRVPVTLYLDLSERLSQPTIKFDIGIDRVDPKIKSYVESKLQSLQVNEAEMNNQIFGVLVLSRFIPSYSALENSLAGSNTSDAVLNTVTELVSSQLSRYLTDWSSTIVKDLEFFVNFSSYDNTNFSEETLEKRRELQLALSKRFFNDRLIINVGGNVDFADTNSDPTASSSTFFGANVSFEYAVTKNRRWRIKAFTISDYDNYNTTNNRNTRSGVGLSYRREFDDIFDLFNIKRKNKDADSKDK